MTIQINVNITLSKIKLGFWLKESVDYKLIDNMFADPVDQ